MLLRDALPKTRDATPVAMAAPGCADDAQLIACHWRLHARLAQSDDLFDRSWECGPVRLQDRLRWADRIFEMPGLTPHAQPLFSQVTERLILLAPEELQRLLCATALLVKRDALRRCINGAVVRRLQETVGTPALAAILRSRTSAPSDRSDSDLSVGVLLAQAYARLARAYAGEWPMVLHCLRLALPADLPTGVETRPASTRTVDDIPPDDLLRQAHAWYPELTWLYG